MIFAFNISTIETWETLGQVLTAYLRIILFLYIGTYFTMYLYTKKIHLIQRTSDT